MKLTKLAHHKPPLRRNRPELGVVQGFDSVERHNAQAKLLRIELVEHEAKIRERTRSELGVMGEKKVDPLAISLATLAVQNLLETAKDDLKLYKNRPGYEQITGQVVSTELSRKAICAPIVGLAAGLGTTALLGASGAISPWASAVLPVVGSIGGALYGGAGRGGYTTEYDIGVRERKEKVKELEAAYARAEKAHDAAYPLFDSKREAFEWGAPLVGATALGAGLGMYAGLGTGVTPALAGAAACAGLGGLAGHWVAGRLGYDDPWGRDSRYEKTLAVGQAAGAIAGAGLGYACSNPVLAWALGGIGALTLGGYQLYKSIE